MQRVEDFSELFRLKQSRQKKTQSKPWRSSSDAFTRPVYLQTNPRHRPEREREKNEEETDRKPFPRFPRTPTGGPLDDGSKIWMS